MINRRAFIPATLLHRPLLRRSIELLWAHFGTLPVCVVCPNPPDLKSVLPSEVLVISDSDVACASREAIRSLLAEDKKHLASWYYQQILKYALIEKTPESSVSLILDADTWMLAPLDDVNNHFYCSGERHQPYRDTYLKLVRRPWTLTRSAVVNFMWFRRDLLLGLLQQIEMTSQDAWWRAILDCSNASLEETAFSEYETYANWRASQVSSVQYLRLKIFRRGDLLTTDSVLDELANRAKAKGYQVLSFEYGHRRNGLMRAAARLAFQLRFSW